MIKISSIFKRYQKNKSLTKITAVREYIKVKRAEIYEQYSQDIYDRNGERNGYTLEVTDKTSLEEIYLFNILDIELRNLSREISALKD
jgi:hypothetical protein